MSAAELWAVFLQFSVLSFLSIGGAISVTPEMHRYMVDERALLTEAQFTSSIAIAQAAPGPNLLFVAVMGYQVAGLAGAAATLIGIMWPSAFLAVAAERYGQRYAHSRAVQAFRAGLAPVTVGLLVSTAWILAPRMQSLSDWPAAALFFGALALAYTTKLQMLLLLGAGAALGAFGFV